MLVRKAINVNLHGAGAMRGDRPVRTVIGARFVKVTGKCLVLDFGGHRYPGMSAPTDDATPKHSLRWAAKAGAALPPLEASTKTIDPMKCMGKWFVTHVIPNFIEKIPGVYNETEEYEWDEANKRFLVTLSFAKGSPTAPRTVMKQRGWFYDAVTTGTEWRVSPIVLGWALPVKLRYIIIDCADDYSSMTVGYPDRSLLWVMARESNPPAERLRQMLAVPEELGYDMSKVKPVPQEWSA